MIEEDLLFFQRLAPHLQDASLDATQANVHVDVVWSLGHLLRETEVVLLLLASRWSRRVAGAYGALALSP